MFYSTSFSLQNISYVLNRYKILLIPFKKIMRNKCFTEHLFYYSTVRMYHILLFKNHEEKVFYRKSFLLQDIPHVSYAVQHQKAGPRGSSI